MVMRFSSKTILSFHSLRFRSDQAPTAAAQVAQSTPPTHQARNPASSRTSLFLRGVTTRLEYTSVSPRPATEILCAPPYMGGQPTSKTSKSTTQTHTHTTEMWLWDTGCMTFPLSTYAIIYTHTLILISKGVIRQYLPWRWRPSRYVDEFLFLGCDKSVDIGLLVDIVIKGNSLNVGKAMKLRTDPGV